MSDATSRLNAALEGRYRIERQLGEGGMATVYLAQDLRHDRKVALKVLKPELAAVIGAERFLAEIKTTANLQHPHILPLHDSGAADGLLFYVMPYVTGETLRDRIDREKQLPVDEALGIATSVASALQHAHDRGVIHRDIKPGNIMLQDGQPVVGDFGIALAMGAASGARLTETGLSVGTPYYMSPEQATGDQAIGPASDTYALACVLYEMLIGEPPYPGSTAQAVLGKIIQGVPVSATAVRKAVPANVDAAIRRALEKLPADRFTSAQTFAKALADPTFRHGADAAAAGPAPVRLRRIAIAGWATAAAAVVALVVSALLPTPEPVRRVERFADPFVEGQEMTSYYGALGFDLSPDGSMLVYRRDTDAGQILMVRRWDDLRATAVRETTDGSGPAVSLDGLELAFEQDGAVRVLAFSGGPVRTLLPDGFAPEWGPGGYLYAGTNSGAVRIPSVGGAVEQISRLSDGENLHIVRDVMPDGRHALLEVSLAGTSEIRSLDLRSGEMTPIVAEGVWPRYLPTGHLVYGTPGGGTMMAARFDPDRMELLSTPIAVMDGLLFFSLADDGKLFYSGIGLTGAAGAGPVRQLAWVTRDGEVSAVDPAWTFDRGIDAEQGWSLSDDGSMVALREFTQGGYDIWIKRLDAGPRSLLTPNEAHERMPVWEPGTDNVTFLSDRNGNFDVWSRPWDGTGEAELLLDIDAPIRTAEWSPDGEWLVMDVAGDILGFRPRVDDEPTVLLGDSRQETEPSVSPDGRWIAYASNETGEYQVYVRPFPDVRARRWQVSSQGGRLPQWAHSRNELYFQQNSGATPMWVVEYESSERFEYGTPAVLFEGPDGWSGAPQTGNTYDVAPDDERFLIALNALAPGLGGGVEGAPLARVVLVNNFFEVLEQMVPE